MPDELGSLPGKLNVAVVVGAFEVLWWLAIVVQGVGIHTLLWSPGRVAVEGSLHMIAVCARTHNLVVEVVIVFYARFDFPFASVDVEGLVFGGYGPIEMDVLSFGDSAEVFRGDQAQAVVGHGVSRQHARLGTLGIEHFGLAVLAEADSADADAFTLGVEASGPADGDFGVGRDVVFRFGAAATFVNGEVLRRHGVAETHLQLAAFGAPRRVGGDGEPQVLVVAQDNPLRLAGHRRVASDDGADTIGVVAVVGAGVFVAEGRLGEVVGQHLAVAIDDIALDVGDRVPTQHHLVVLCVDVGHEVVWDDFVIHRAVGEAHAVAAFADVVDAELLVNLPVGIERHWVGRVVEDGVAEFDAVGGCVGVARIVDVAVGMEDIHLVELVFAVIAGIAVIARVDAVDEQAAVR